MRWAEVKELAGMFCILGMLVTAGLGVRSMAVDASEVGEVPEVPAAELPAVVGPYQAVGPADSAGAVSQLPVGVPLGV